MKMKNIRVALLACMVALFAVSCEKEAEEENESPAFSGDRFKIEIASFRDADNSKAYLNFTEASSNIIYESGDKVQINGRSFTLTYDDGSWWANADNGQPYTGDILYTAYCDGTLNAWDSNAAGGPQYNFNINDYIDNNTHNKIVLCGTSSKDGGTAITLRPACAILRVYTGNSGSTWTNVRVGFNGGIVPATGSINPATQVITPTTYLEGVSQGSGGSINGDFLAMRWSKQSSAPGNHASSESGYWYVAIPIPGNSVTTTLYLGWNNGSTDVQFKTQGQVELRKGYVYTVGTERQSPFDAQGVGKYYFYVDGSSHKVAFTAGNLQSQSYVNGYDDDFKWQFASTQMAIIGSGNNSIGATGQWFDLFGYGTSNWDESPASEWWPSATSTTNSDYYSGDLKGTNADWGKKNGNTPGIYYGSTLVHVNKFRTLTRNEWTYIINRTDGSQKLSGLVRIDGAYFGLMLLPSTGESGVGNWTNTTDVDISDLSHSSVKSLSASDWDKLEAIGAIFLPAAGSRTGTTSTQYNSAGYYWTSTQYDANNGSILYFDDGLVSVGTSDDISQKNKGCAVRLVCQIGTYSPSK